MMQTLQIAYKALEYLFTGIGFLILFVAGIMCLVDFLEWLHHQFPSP